MSGDYTKAVFGTLDTGASEFASTYAQVVSTVDNLDSQLRSSLSTWTGAAQAAYYEAKAKWDQAIGDMAAVIQSMGQVVDTANQNFQGAENANRSMWT
jgi:early secretory antigenic target protein ESAT-6